MLQNLSIINLTEHQKIYRSHALRIQTCRQFRWKDPEQWKVHDGSAAQMGFLSSQKMHQTNTSQPNQQKQTPSFNFLDSIQRTVSIAEKKNISMAQGDTRGLFVCSKLSKVFILTRTWAAARDGDGHLGEMTNHWQHGSELLRYTSHESCNVNKHVLELRNNNIPHQNNNIIIIIIITTTFMQTQRDLNTIPTLYRNYPNQTTQLNQIQTRLLFQLRPAGQRAKAGPRWRMGRLF